MADASFVQHSFLGGEVAKTVQGRFDRPDYRTYLNVCLNSLPLEQGPWVRRPGTVFAGTTRGGTFGREIPFEFEQAATFRMEFTANHLRFRQGTQLVPEIEVRGVASQTQTSPVQITLSSTTIVPYLTGDDVYFPVTFAGTPVGDPLVMNRLFRIIVIDQLNLLLIDPVTGDNIDGSVVNFAGLLMYRLVDFPTPFAINLLPGLRSVQAEKNALLLTGQLPPQLLQVLSDPGGLDGNLQPITAGFELAPAVFLDGPYLDPIPGGALILPASLNGLVSMTIQFPTYNATTAYPKGSFAFFNSLNYQSLQDANVGHQPDQNPSFWQPVSSGIAVGPNGFVGTDVGRLIRLFSEPPPWTFAQAYTVGQNVSYPNGVDGGLSYWTAIQANNGVIPGTNATLWAINANGAIWTWGKIISLNNLLLIGSGTVFGDLPNPTAAFDGNTNKSSQFCAATTTSDDSIDLFVGIAPQTPTPISACTVYPSSEQGFGNVIAFFSGGGSTPVAPQVILNLWGGNADPASPTNGTLLGTTGVIANIYQPITIQSADTITIYRFLWVEIQSSVTGAPGITISHTVAIAQVQFFSSVSAGGGNAVTVEILGLPLLYTTPIAVWRLGLFSNTTGYPKCGVYHEGRIWLSGIIGNRFDASVANGLLANGNINFAPTNPDGSVTDNNGISYVCNADDINPIFWMASDQVGIVCGTQGGEWLIQASNLNNVISPTNIQAKRFSKYKVANIEPRRTPGTLAVVQYYQQKLLEYFADVFSGRLGAQNITWKAQHLVSRVLMELAFQQERTPIIWARCLDGSLIGITYERENLMSAQEPNFAGAHQHILGSGRKVSGICAATIGESLSTISMVTVDSSMIYHVEVLSNIFIETDQAPHAWFLDDAVIPIGTVLPPGGGVIPPPPVTVNISLSTNSINFPNVANANSFVAAVTVTSSAGPYAGTLTLGGKDAAKFALSNGGVYPCNLLTGPTNLAAANYHLTVTASGATPTTQSFTIFLTITTTVTIGLSTTTVNFPTSADANSFVATITVTSSAGPYAGTLTLGGPDGSKFALSNGGVYPCNLMVGPVNIPASPPGNPYQISITAP